MLRKHNYMLGLLVFIIVTVAFGMNSTLVSAGQCVAQMSDTNTGQYYGSSVQLPVTVTATCSFSGGQLYVVGNAYDTSLNANVNSDYTLLTSVNDSNVYNGQVVFNLPPIVQGDTVQISISIYTNGPNGSLITTAAQTLQFSSSFTSSGYYYPRYYCYPGSYCSYPSYPTYPSYPSHPSPPHEPPPNPHH